MREPVRWLGAVLSMVVLGGAASASASDDVCSIGTRTMSIAPFAASVAEDASLDAIEAQLAAEAFAAWALSASVVEPSAPALAAAGEERTPNKAVLMCVGSDPARCLPAAPPPASVRFEVARTPRAQTASGWDIAPAGWSRATFTTSEERRGPEGVRSAVDRPPRARARA
ncbi:MAG: hypothetical protein IT379_01055 [Deltaproteobacteria bacterium]|nr:hypothetical protein [Deltaproteobacteria bacterium]